MKKYLIIAGLLIGAVILIISLFNRIEKLTNDLSAAQNNYTELLRRDQDNVNLILTLKEIRALQVLKIDSLAHQLKIKPKTITKIIEKIVTEKDTVFVELDPMEILDNIWTISDSTKCWLWQGQVETYRQFDSIAVGRTNFEYRNKIDEVFWYVRKKVLFLPIGKKMYFQRSMPECGEVITRSIEIKRK